MTQVFIGLMASEAVVDDFVAVPEPIEGLKVTPIGPTELTQPTEVCDFLRAQLGQSCRRLSECLTHFAE